MNLALFYNDKISIHVETLVEKTKQYLKDSKIKDILK